MIKKVILLLVCFLFSNYAFTDSLIHDVNELSNNNQQEIAQGFQKTNMINNCDFQPQANQKLESTLYTIGCCKICTKGKACGNSCISRSYTCHQPPGCACDG